MSNGRYELLIKWPSGQSTLSGEITDQQYGEICRVLSPDRRAELAALKAGQGEAVAWRWAWKECREDDGWTYRESPPFDPTTVVVQALYLAPPASAGARLVPVELLRDICSLIPEKMKPARKEIRALLAQSQEAKS